MAGKRMFSKQVLLGDAFLDMSAEARALYVTLNMCADDDGLVNNADNGFYLYEIVPGFIVGLIAAVVVTLIDKAPKQEVCDLYDKAVSADFE